MLTETQKLFFLAEELDLADLPASKKTDKIISKLNSKLKKILDEIRPQVGNILAIKQKYQKQVHDLIRFAVEDCYFLGLDYSDKALKQRQPVTVKDVQKLDQITAEFENRFWNIVMKLEPVKEFSFSVALAYISSLVSNMLIKALNTATITNLEPLELDDYTHALQVIFKTREDEKVCQICEPLNNNVYDVDDDTKPEIPDDTHPNCRCRYLVYQDGKEIAG